MDAVSKHIELQISKETLKQYRELALDHLSRNNAIAEVAEAGLDDKGRSVFGIRIVYPDGEEWYDVSEVGESSILGWLHKEDADKVLQSKVLPNLGYTILQRDLQQFHRNM